MSTLADTVKIVGDIPDSDPVISAAKWVFLVVTILGAVSLPFMMLMKRKNNDKNENQIESAIVGAGSALYAQLVKQISEYKTIAEDAFRERNALFDRVTKLEHIAEKLELAEKLITDLQKALSSKDEQIKALLRQASDERVMLFNIIDRKDTELRTRDARIEHLEKAMNTLQVSMSTRSGEGGFGLRRFTDQEEVPT